MKKYIILGSIAAMVALTGCNDFLNDNRYPLSQQTSNPEFWSNPDNVQGQINYLYETFSGYGVGAGQGTFYFKTLTDDQCGRTGFTNWTDDGNVPTSSTNWSTPYSYIRSCNQIITGVTSGSLNETTQGNNFIGIARLIRAYQYYKLVRAYGDVPLVDKVLDPESPEVYGPRTPRNEVMDFVLEDLNYAVANINTSGKAVFSTDMAQAMKAEICLFEGTYAKYHQGNETRMATFLNEVVKAGEAIASKYPVGTTLDSYHALYNSWYTAMNANNEVIFTKLYSDNLMNSIQDYTSPSDGVAGITKDAFDSYLFLDGKLVSNTKYNTASNVATYGKNLDLGQWSMVDGAPELNIQDLLDMRDGRLSVVTYPNVFYRTNSGARTDWLLKKYQNTADMWSITGYGVYKYNDLNIPDILTTTNKVCAPLFWGARLNLAILEAKAELGTITDNDINTYMAPLWKRAGFEVDPSMALLNAINDPKNTWGVSNLIWEIRRCRRCELIMDDDIRYWDLVRWKMLEKVSNELYPEIMMGANIGDNPLINPAVGTDSFNYNPIKTETGTYLNASYGQSRPWNNKYYFYAVPSGQITLNPNLTQNPGY